jgi:hypothetical protein
MSRRLKTVLPTTSEKLALLESRVKAAFAKHEAQLTLIDIPPTPRANATPGELAVIMSKRASAGDPADTVRQWGAAFRAEVTSLLGELDAIKAEGAQFRAIARYLKNNEKLPGGIDPQLRAAAFTLFNQTDKSLALNTARRIELLIDDQMNEIDRMKAVWASKSSAAADLVIAKRSAEFLRKCGRSGDAAIYDKQHKELAERRAAMSKRSRRNEVPQ